MTVVWEESIKCPTWTQQNPEYEGEGEGMREKLENSGESVNQVLESGL